MVVEVPLCYRFSPTERELVEFYLIPKARGLALPAGHQILERSLYGDEAAPWKVLNDDDPWQWCDDSMRKKIVYVFSRVIAKNGQSKNRTVRTAGCGTWDGKAVGRPIIGTDGSVVGSRRAFTFKPKKEFENETRGKWIMHEYSLPNGRDYKDGDVVVCRISNHVEKEKEGSTNEDEESGLDSDAESNSVEKTSKRKAIKRVRIGGVIADKTGNQEGGRGVGVDMLGLSVGGVFGDQRLNNQEIVVAPCTSAFAESNEDQEVVPYPATTPQYPYERPTPITYDFFK